MDLAHERLDVTTPRWIFCFSPVRSSKDCLAAEATSRKQFSTFRARARARLREDLNSATGPRVRLRASRKGVLRYFASCFGDCELRGRPCDRPLLEASLSSGLFAAEPDDHERLRAVDHDFARAVAGQTRFVCVAFTRFELEHEWSDADLFAEVVKAHLRRLALHRNFANAVSRFGRVSSCGCRRGGSGLGGGRGGSRGGGRRSGFGAGGFRGDGCGGSGPRER